MWWQTSTIRRTLRSHALGKNMQQDIHGYLLLIDLMVVVSLLFSWKEHSANIPVFNVTRQVQMPAKHFWPLLFPIFWNNIVAIVYATRLSLEQKCCAKKCGTKFWLLRMLAKRRTWKLNTLTSHSIPVLSFSKPNENMKTMCCRLASAAALASPFCELGATSDVPPFFSSSAVSPLKFLSKIVRVILQRLKNYHNFLQERDAIGNVMVHEPVLLSTSVWRCGVMIVPATVPSPVPRIKARRTLSLPP